MTYVYRSGRYWYTEWRCMYEVCVEDKEWGWGVGGGICIGEERYSKKEEEGRIRVK